MPSVILEQSEQPVKLSSNQVKTIAIIGGGASGAIALDSLLKENNFDNIILFERRSILGGIWAFDKETIKTPNHIIKSGYVSTQTDPQLSNPFKGDASRTRFVLRSRTTQERFEETPSYQGIKSNIIEKMMTYSDANQWDVPGATNLEERKYVDGLIVQKYIDAYISRNLTDNRVELVQNSTVEDVERISKVNNDIPYKFRLTIRQPVNDESDIWWQQDFDSIVVATGHYHVPYIPYVEGLNVLQEKFDDVVQHAKFYRSPDVYKGKTVLIIGSRASGADLTKFIANTAAHVYQSIRNLDNTKKLSKKPNLTYKSVVKQYQIIDDRNFKVIFDDDSELINPDHIIYATGYQFSYPFLNRLFNESSNELTKEGIIIPNLYQHTFFINEPLITFIGVPIDGISFRVFEYQAILISRYLSGKIELPNSKIQREWASKRLEEKGITRAYHTIGVNDALKYISELVALGSIKTEKMNTGRKFPKITENDVALYKAAGEELRKFWDER